MDIKNVTTHLVIVLAVFAATFFFGAFTALPDVLWPVSSFCLCGEGRELVVLLPSFDSIFFMRGTRVI